MATADTYLIRIRSGEISLAGKLPRATLFSVYRFLEKYLGCGWVMPGDDFVPRRPTWSCRRQLMKWNHRHSIIGRFACFLTPIARFMTGCGRQPVSVCIAADDQRPHRLGGEEPAEFRTSGRERAGPRLWEKGAFSRRDRAGNCQAWTRSSLRRSLVFRLAATGQVFRRVIRTTMRRFRMASRSLSTSRIPKSPRSWREISANSWIRIRRFRSLQSG